MDPAGKASFFVLPGDAHSQLFVTARENTRHIGHFWESGALTELITIIYETAGRKIWNQNCIIVINTYLRQISFDFNLTKLISARNETTSPSWYGHCAKLSLKPGFLMRCHIWPLWTFKVVAERERKKTFFYLQPRKTSTTLNHRATKSKSPELLFLVLVCLFVSLLNV